jgi:signal transduction histidine kinase
VAKTTVAKRGAAQAINAPVQRVSENLRFLGDAFADVTRLLDTWQSVCDAAKRGPLPPALVDEAQAALAEIDVARLKREIPLAVEQAIEAMKGVADVIRRMRDLAAPPASVKVPTDLASVVEGAATIARAECVKTVDVETHVADGLPPIVACGGDLQRALLLLVERAEQAIAGVVAKRDGVRGRIRITADRSGEQIRVVVEDDGEEIASECCTSLFEKSGYEGEVNPLAEVAEIVRDRHGGRILFESGTGRGTRFHLLLPLTPIVEPSDSREPPKS